MIERKRRSKHDAADNSMKAILYASAFASLLYATIATRPHIAQAMAVVSRFMVNLGKAH